jgi:DNA-binding PadR family transcriptional regulator
MMHIERRLSGRGHFPGRDRSLRGSRRSRAQRGDVRAATLILLAEHPMHGYQLMQAMTERTGGAWQPSPGAIYPTIAQLEDEGLVTVTVEGGRKLVSLTDAGRTYLDDPSNAVTDPFAAITASDASAPSLRTAIAEVHNAARSVAATGTRAQIAAAQSVLSDARRALYLILAEGPDGSTETPGNT